MGKIKVSVFIILFCCSSCSIFNSKRNYVEQQVKNDYEIYLFFKHNGQAILDLKDYTYECRNEKVALFFDVDNNKGTYRIVLIKNKADIVYIRNTDTVHYENEVDLTKDFRANKLIETAYVCDSIFKSASCYFYDYPRIGYNLRYYRDDTHVETGDLLKIDKNWFYSMNRWTGHNRKFAISCFNKYFKEMNR